jgi:hypothetical protein
MADNPDEISIKLNNLIKERKEMLELGNLDNKKKGKSIHTYLIYTDCNYVVLKILHIVTIT